jgi:hypothetical protein
MIQKMPLWASDVLAEEKFEKLVIDWKGQLLTIQLAEIK